MISASYGGRRSANRAKAGRVPRSAGGPKGPPCSHSVPDAPGFSSSGRFDAAINTVAVADLDRDVRALSARDGRAPRRHSSTESTADPRGRRADDSAVHWGTFTLALAVYGELSGASTLAGRDIARQLGDIRTRRVPSWRHSFLPALRVAVVALLRCRSLDQSHLAVVDARGTNRWATLLDATKFYDPVKQQVINLPENYLGVAARIAAMSFGDMGFLKDRALLDGLLDRAAVQFTSGALFADDALPTGRYDRYSTAIARYIWDAAQIAGRRTCSTHWGRR